MSVTHPVHDTKYTRFKANATGIRGGDLKTKGQPSETKKEGFELVMSDPAVHRVG